VARLNKLLTELELELAQCDESITKAELRQNAVEETSRRLTAELDARTSEVFAVKIHGDNVEAKYAATSALSTTAAQRRIAKAARRVTEESQRAAEEKSKEAESSAQTTQAYLLKVKSKSQEHRKKTKHYKLKAAHYKSKAKRFHSQILAFTKVRDQTWVNGFS
jgi:Tfp pilus assembly protein FimV